LQTRLTIVGALGKERLVCVMNILYTYSCKPTINGKLCDDMK